jgi:type IV pilus assembly protein PilP
MHKYYIIFRKVVVFCICFLFILTGCEKQAETPKTQKIISKKVIVPSKKTVQAQPAEKAPEAPATVIAPGTAPQELKAVPETKPEKQETVSVPSIAIAKKPGEIAYVYDPVGKIDPFAPIFKAQEQATPTAAEKQEKEKRIPQTPLEKISLSQLKLSAIMLAPSGAKALVEEQSGKGYIITKGTYIGTNAGQVVDILKDRVIITEEAEDLLGNLTIRKTEMKLQKSPGE